MAIVKKNIVKPQVIPRKNIPQDPMKWVNPDTGEIMVISYSQQLQKERLMLERAKLRESIRRRKLHTFGLVLIIVTLVFLLYVFYRLDQLNAVMNFLLK